jgi:hypothetical protein
MLRRMALVRTDVSEELSASFIRVTRIGELGTLAVASNRRTRRRNLKKTATAGSDMPQFCRCDYANGSKHIPAYSLCGLLVRVPGCSL